MSRGIIRVGDRTSHGGVVASGCDCMTVDGKAAAQLGDVCTCPIHGQCCIVEGYENHTVNGKPVAYHGHKTTCGAVLLSSCTTYTIEPGGGMEEAFGAGTQAVSKSALSLAESLAKPRALPASNQEAIAILKPIAEKCQGQKGDVLVMIWSWEGLGVVLPHDSVGHVAAAVKNQRGQWQIVQSQFPHGPGEPSRSTGPNTTIADLIDLRKEEGGRLPNKSFRITLPNLGAYAQAAIQDLEKPSWNWDPRWRGRKHVLRDSETNCTFGVIKALWAGGAKLDGLTAAKRFTFIGCWLPKDLASYLEDEKAFNVIREKNKPSEQWFIDQGQGRGSLNGMRIMQSLPWKE